LQIHNQEDIKAHILPAQTLAENLYSKLFSQEHKKCFCYGNICIMKIMFLVKMIRYWFVFYAVFCSTSLFAVEVKDLYLAKVPVASQSKKDRGFALKNAMQSVLVKVGGEKTIFQHPALKPSLNRYNRFVTHYRYERIANENYLVATFNQDKINQLFVDAGLPIWGSLRPQVVLWLINEDGLMRQILSESSLSPLAKQINLFSEQRGLPVIIPLMDLTDANHLATSDIWGRFAEPIYQASERYLAETIITVRLSNSSLLSSEALNEGCELICQPKNVLDWSFISSSNNEIKQEFSEQYQGSDSQALLTEALNDITDKIYQSYALTTEFNNDIQIDVANIDSLNTYVQVDRFLQAHSSVLSVKLIKASGSTRRFNLTLLGSKQALLASLKLNDALRQYIDPLALVDPEQVPIFYWRKR